MYDKGVIFCHGHDNGTIQNYINDSTGQIRESGRDQGHFQLGIGALATVCEIAYNQGDNLYAVLNNRLLKGFEYVEKYNLGNDDVPFFTWKHVSGSYCNWTKNSDQSRGKFILFTKWCTIPQLPTVASEILVKSIGKTVGFFTKANFLFVCNFFYLRKRCNCKSMIL